ncbi:MAG TPA: DUF421 domain-containing protein [Bacilli bacterium]|nr:DUF421 domain-containing protein [Bacilli bacterium]
MSGIVEIAIRTLAAYAILLVLANVFGKHTMSQRTYHGFIAAITFGTIAGNLAFNIKVPPHHFITSLVVAITVISTLAFVSLRYQRARRWIAGTPTVLIEDGKILEGNLRKLRYTLDTLNHALRDKGIFNIDEVEYALLEINGSLNVLKKPEYRPVTKKDLGLATGGSSVPIELIMDGEVMERNLHDKQISQAWLDQELEKRAVSLNDVCYAVLGTDGRLFFDYYEDQLQHPVDPE